MTSNTLNNTVGVQTEVVSSLALQVLLFFNFSWHLVWLGSMMYAVGWKLLMTERSSLFIYFTPGIVLLAAAVDWARLRMGYSGNLQERVPELAGFILVSVFPVLACCGYFVAIQRMFTPTLPIEYVVNGVYCLFLIVELVLAYRMTKSVVSAQAQNFFLTATFADDETATNTNNTLKPFVKDSQTSLYSNRSIRQLNIRSSRILQLE